MKSKRIVLAAVLAVLALAAVGAGALALTGDEPFVPSDVRAPVAAVDAGRGLNTHLSTLARDPVSLNGRFDYVQLAQAGGNLNAARKAQTTAGGGTVFLVPSRDGACLTSSPLLEAGCFGSAELTGGVTVSSIICAPALAARAIEVYGTAPDGVDTVTIERENGNDVSVDVVGNVYVFTAPTSASRPLAVTWTQQGKSGSVDAGVPADFRDGRCATDQERQDAGADAGPSPDGGPAVRSADEATQDLHDR